MRTGCHLHFLLSFVVQRAQDSGEFWFGLFGPSYLCVFRFAAVVSTTVIEKSFDFIELGTTIIH